MNWKDGITTRAVLYDIAQLKGVDWVDPEHADHAAPTSKRGRRKSGVKIGPGDIPLLYIGRWKRRAALGAWTGQVAGYYPDTIPWMHERLPSFIGHDFNIDWNPRPGWEGMRNPIHVAVLNWMGINIVECLDLEQAVADGAAAEPLRVPDHVRAAAGRRRNGIAGESTGRVLTRRLRAQLLAGATAWPRPLFVRPQAQPRSIRAASTVAARELPANRRGPIGNLFASEVSLARRWRPPLYDSFTRSPHVRPFPRD